MSTSRIKGKLLRRTRPKQGSVLFKRKLLKKVLKGKKTQTRRIHKRTLKTGKIYGI